MEEIPTKICLTMKTIKHLYCELCTGAKSAIYSCIVDDCGDATVMIRKLGERLWKKTVKHVD